MLISYSILVIKNHLAVKMFKANQKSSNVKGLISRILVNILVGKIFPIVKRVFHDDWLCPLARDDIKRWPSGQGNHSYENR